MRFILIIIIILTLALAVFFLYRSFSSSTTISSEERADLAQWKIQSGGPPKDGIPAIDQPQYTTAAEANQWLKPNDVIFGVAQGNFVAAYPQRILVWHEIINEKIDDQEIAITYCPLTGTTIGYQGNFGVSGKLTNSNLIMYDRATDSYWPQIWGQAITGPRQDQKLEEFPVIWTTWEKWRARYPQTKVLSRTTGFFRDYEVGGDPYGNYLAPAGEQGYYNSPAVIFELVNEDNRLPAKTVVIGLRNQTGQTAAIVKDKLRKERRLQTKLGEQSVTVTYDPALDSFIVDQPVSAFEAMWFAWAAFYPETTLIQ